MTELEVTDSPDEADVEEVLAGVLAFNERFLGQRELRPLAVLARDGGRLVGGLTGATARGFLEIEFFWVEEARRGHGLGSRLLRAAEEEARRRGCHSVHLSTYEFQARPFYERHGFSLFGELTGLAGGHRTFYLAKRLASADG